VGWYEKRKKKKKTTKKKVGRRWALLFRLEICLTKQKKKKGKVSQLAERVKGKGFRPSVQEDPGKEIGGGSHNHARGAHRREKKKNKRVPLKKNMNVTTRRKKGDEKKRGTWGRGAHSGLGVRGGAEPYKKSGWEEKEKKKQTGGW